MSDIAIVGIGCRFGGGIDSPESFGEFVVDKRDAVVEIPEDRWDYRHYYDPNRRVPGRSYTKHDAFMTSNSWEFDPDFFGISPREAVGMACQALENGDCTVAMAGGVSVMLQPQAFWLY
ncbi:beta-ketoacyl synthase N-terminal-like domain-containing protein [Nocardia brevicatena]|uniref:beta-ketoacyl synthase N-terminal-like domain-containing protein n=1 Tax=Nocardia brevicatena TaxID=37327 RepID=UPI0002E87085|nr:beta-ketoacyl synthase N-terminal-like domain-containing protein [Nocardia brevicatena]